MRRQILNAINSVDCEPVRINQEMCRHLAQKWVSEPFSLPTWDTPIVMDNTLEVASAYYFFGNIINFGFCPKEETMGPVGDTDFWLILRTHPELLNPSNLSSMAQEEFQGIFGPLPFLETRVTIWREAARALRLKYNGRVTELYEANHWNAPEIVQAMAKDFPGFRDTQRTVPFLRKAQLTLFMTQARFQPNILFTNLDRLTVGSDLQVFNGLLQLGVLELPEDLLRRLSSSALPAGEDLEFALRCATVLAAEALLENINELRKHKITTCQLDYVLRRIGTQGKAPLPLAFGTNY